MDKDAISLLLGHNADRTVTDVYISKSVGRIKQELAKADDVLRELCDAALSAQNTVAKATFVV